MADQTSIRGNMVNSGGVSTTTASGQGQPLLPDTYTLKKLSEIFAERSESNVIQLTQQALVPGQVSNFIINNVGLGESLELWVEGSVTVNKSDAATCALTLSHEFPYNMIQNINVQFNGQTVLANLSGYELLGLMAKRNKNFIQGAASSAGVRFAQNLSRVDKAQAYITAGTGCTLAAGNNIAGVTTATVQASGDSIINFGFYLELPFVLRKDLLLGLIPMQNNSVYCNVSITSPALLGTTAASPLFNSTLPATVTLKSSNIAIYPHYNFWSIPTPNDAKLYAYLVSHSYMLLSQGSNTLSKTGAEAFQYLMPNNYYLLGLLATIRDSTGALMDVNSATAGLDNLYLNYNGTARVDRRKMGARIARQSYYYGSIPSPLGQIVLDLTDVEFQTNGVNTSKWLNMYLANNPLIVADVQSGFSVSGTFSMLREQLVPANVQLI
jgi:hypothetical protein